MKAGLLPSQAHSMTVKFHWFKDRQEFLVLFRKFYFKDSPREQNSPGVYLNLKFC